MKLAETRSTSPEYNIDEQKKKKKKHTKINMMFMFCLLLRVFVISRAPGFTNRRWRLWAECQPKNQLSLFLGDVNKKKSGRLSQTLRSPQEGEGTGAHLFKLCSDITERSGQAGNPHILPARHPCKCNTAERGIKSPTRNLEFLTVNTTPTMLIT